MSFCWELYIDLAERLRDNKESGLIEQAYLRSAISRSYYGVFCRARNFVLSKGHKKPRKMPVHQFVRENLVNSDNQREIEIGNYLFRLWGKRVDADYKENKSFTLGDVSLCIISARSASENLRRKGF